MHITKHGKNRYKNRRGLPLKSISKEVEKARLLGLTSNSSIGKLKWYLFSKSTPFNQAIYYSGFIWVFEGSFFITLYPIPGSIIN